MIAKAPDSYSAVPVVAISTTMRLGSNLQTRSWQEQNAGFTRVPSHRCAHVEGCKNLTPHPWPTAEFSEQIQPSNGTPPDV